MAFLFEQLFQGQPVIRGEAARADVAEVSGASFPLSPAIGLPEDCPGYKLARLSSGALMLAVVRSRGDRDRFGRAVKRATGCVFLPEDLKDGFRDPVAVFRSLDEPNTCPDVAALAATAESVSTLFAPSSFARMVGALSAAPEFYARAAVALTMRSANVFVPEGSDILAVLEPAFALLSSAELQRMELATGSVPGAGPRERVLVIQGQPSTTVHPSPRWRGLLGRTADEGHDPCVVDFVSWVAPEVPRIGRRWLVDATLDPKPWPGFEAQSRYQLMMRCLDAKHSSGRPRDPFEASPELADLRAIVQRIERVAHALSVEG